MRERTAIIKDVHVGLVEYRKGLTMSCTSDSDGLCAGMFFTMDQALEMMQVANVRDIESLEGKPCQIEGDWGEQIKFIRMWKG